MPVYVYVVLDYRGFPSATFKSEYVAKAHAGVIGGKVHKTELR